MGSNSSSTGVFTDTGAFSLATDTDASTTQAGTATGTLTINGGTANLSSGIVIGAGTAHSNTVATVNLNGGLLNVSNNGIGNAVPNGTSTITVNLPSGSNSATIENLGGSGIFATAGTGAGTSGVVMGATGTLILAGNNTYSGPTTVNTGTLQIGTGTLGGSLPAASTVTNNSIMAFGGSILNFDQQ